MKTIMKLIILIAMLFPMTSLASQTPPPCDPNYTKDHGALYCSEIQLVEWNLVDLQNQVANLQSQNWQLQQQLNQTNIAPVPTITEYITDDSRIFALENRVSALEKTVTYIQQTLIKPIQVSINKIRKILKF
jgi:hypothetical protein